MQARAIKKYVRTSPQKLRRVAVMVRDLSPQAALEKLPFVGQRAATALAKTIQSAVANARTKGMEESKLIFKEIQINEGPRLKRGRPGPRGRWKPYQRKTSHIRVILESQEKQEKEDKKNGTKS